MDCLASQDGMLSRRVSVLTGGGAGVRGAEPPAAGVPGAEPPGAGVPGAEPPAAGVPGAEPPAAGVPGAEPPAAGVPAPEPPGAGFNAVSSAAGVPVPFGADAKVVAAADTSAAAWAFRGDGRGADEDAGSRPEADPRAPAPVSPACGSGGLTRTTLRAPPRTADSAAFSA
jgi:hypothetical protein